MATTSLLACRAMKHGSAKKVDNDASHTKHNCEDV